MGMMRILKNILLCICIVFFVSGCSDFNTSNVNLSGICFSAVKASTASAYYLSKEGTLYCKGADIDASAYVKYQDEKNGIVAYNVKSFGEIYRGGYYINNSNDLYLWNTEELPLLNYNTSKAHAKILENVKFVRFGNDCVIFIDISDNMYLIGDFHGETYSVNAPKFIANNVKWADIRGKAVVWTDYSGKFDFYGETQVFSNDDLIDLKNQISESWVEQIEIHDHFILLVKDNDLWFYGDYKRFMSEHHGRNDDFVLEFLPLKENVEVFSASSTVIMALDFAGEAFVWGECVSNGYDNPDDTLFKYYEEYRIANNVKNIYTSGACICYVDVNGSSHIFHAGGWPDFYGNSVDAENVGLEREPNTWIKE